MRKCLSDLRVPCSKGRALGESQGEKAAGGKAVRGCERAVFAEVLQRSPGSPVKPRAHQLVSARSRGSGEAVPCQPRTAAQNSRLPGLQRHRQPRASGPTSHQLARRASNGLLVVTKHPGLLGRIQAETRTGPGVGVFSVPVSSPVASRRVGDC